MKSGLIKIDDKVKFRQQIASEWKKNSRFWLRGNMKHIVDVKKKMIDEIRRLTRGRDLSKIVIIDLGCGEGWLYRALREDGISCEYIGLDLNENFIRNLQTEIHDERAAFLVHDIEHDPLLELIERADIVVNAFNYFEIPDLESAIAHTSRMMKDSSFLVIATIDPIMQLLAISHTSKDFYENLHAYARYKSNLGYRKNIVVNERKTRHFYYGILYSIQDYIDFAKKYHLLIENYSEIVRPEKPTPQIFQFLTFEKS